MTVLQNNKKQIGKFSPEAELDLMDLQNQARSSDDFAFKSFEEIYKSSYSHGLEAIYALETVDLKSVRRLEESKPRNVLQQTVPKKSSPAKFLASDQFELDFGPAYRGWIDSFLLTEPIQVLRLSPQTEKILLSNGKKMIQDIFGMQAKDYLTLKGIGQGHIDESQQKLHEYIGDLDLYHCYEVHFIALLRSILGALDRKKVSISLESFHLSELFPLSPAESVEARHLNADKREEWILQIKGEYKAEARLQFLHASFKKIVEVFVKPWIRCRNGLANLQEIEERLFRVSDDRKIAQQIVKFISTIYCEGQSPLIQHLICLDEGLFCAEEWIVQDYRLVIQKALSYFYKPDVSYLFEQLVSLMQREFGLEWISFPEGFVEKALRYSPVFRVRKGDQGLLIKLS